MLEYQLKLINSKVKFILMIIENKLDINNKKKYEIENSETSLLSEVASSHHEFSTLPGVKESVLELLQNLKSVVFENIFPYSVLLYK
jgi:hypothetical protein